MSKTLAVQWSADGGTWNVLETITGTTSWAANTAGITPSSSSLHIRYTLSGNAGNDVAMIDDIELAGVTQSPEPGAHRPARQLLRD
jgi:hypothetical protein